MPQAIPGLQKKLLYLLGFFLVFFRFFTVFVFFVRRPDPKFDPKAHEKHPILSYSTPLFLFTNYSMNNCKHYFNWL